MAFLCLLVDCGWKCEVRYLEGLFFPYITGMLQM